jgi:cytochrome c oxidase subunit 2
MLLAVLVWLLSIGIVALFAVRRWWFPAAINALGREFDGYFALTSLVTGAIFVAAQLALGWLILRNRDRGDRPGGPEGNNKLEVLWTAAAGVIFVGLAVATTSIWAKVHMEVPSPNALRIDGLAKQFSWSFRYAGPDGKFGRTDIRQINDANGNPFGIDEKDPAGRDDLVSAAIRVPVNTPVRLTLHSRDVIHNFFVRELRMKQDVVPGMEVALPFLADKTGTYEVACSELCGLGHHQMRSTLIVMSQEDFDQWQKQMLDQLKQQ